MEYVIDEVKVSIELDNAIAAGKKLILFQGGTGAGKTRNIIKYFVGLNLANAGIAEGLAAYDYDGSPLTTSVVGPSFPHMRRGVIRDWMTVMEESKIYNDRRHNKTEHIYTYPSKSFIEFFSAENEEKVRGPGRKILYVNEINLFDWETIRQLMVRTDLFIVGDYNPIDEFHWLYDKLLPRQDCHFVEVTYADNPFLPKGRREEIEMNRDTDPDWFLVYGLGKRGKSAGLVYAKFDTDYKELSKYVYAVDFGFNVPTAIGRIGYDDNKHLHLKQLFYELYVTNSALISWIKENIADWRTAKFVCDNAEPDRIEEMKRAGIKGAMECNKKPGVQWVKSHHIHIDKFSPDALKEIRSYKNVKDEKNSRYTDVPVKSNDHLMDVLKYGAAYFFKPKGSTAAKSYD